MTRCTRCDDEYDETRGDGYCGLCPSCADVTDPVECADCGATITMADPQDHHFDDGELQLCPNLHMTADWAEFSYTIEGGPIVMCKIDGKRVRLTGAKVTEFESHATQVELSGFVVTSTDERDRRYSYNDRPFNDEARDAILAIHNRIRDSLKGTPCSE